MLGVDASGASGGNLVPCSVVQWNGSLRTTTFTGPTGLNAAISAADIATAALVPVTVFTLTDGGGGGTSNALTFTVFNPPATAAARLPRCAQSAEGTSGIVSSPSLATPSMSADKRYEVVVLASTDGVTEVPGTPKNIFVRDTCTGAPAGCTPTVTLASIGLNSNPADGDSISPSISADGRYVAFLSSAMNLVDSDTNGVDGCVCPRHLRGRAVRLHAFHAARFHRDRWNASQRRKHFGDDQRVGPLHHVRSPLRPIWPISLPPPDFSCEILAPERIRPARLPRSRWISS